jgi:hypothetical protein
MIWLLPHPHTPYPASKLDRRHIPVGRLRKRGNLQAGQGVGEEPVGEGGAESLVRYKSSILSDFVHSRFLDEFGRIFRL